MTQFDIMNDVVEGLAPSNFILAVFNKIVKVCDATIITLEEAIKNNQ